MFSQYKPTKKASNLNGLLAFLKYFENIPIELW